MSREKVKDIKPVTTDAGLETANVNILPPSAPSESLSEIDRMTLELAKSKRQTALAEAKTALANNENAELHYKYVVLQLYMKYGLTEKDAVSEAGEIIRGGAMQYQKPAGK